MFGTAKDNRLGRLFFSLSQIHTHTLLSPPPPPPLPFNPHQSGVSPARAPAAAVLSGGDREAPRNPTDAGALGPHRPIGCARRAPVTASDSLWCKLHTCAEDQSVGGGAFHLARKCWKTGSSCRQSSPRKVPLFMKANNKMI